MPPPRTESSSEKPVWRRDLASVGVILLMLVVWSFLPEMAPFARADLASVSSMVCSSRVFHWSQLSQRPAHLLKEAPHSWQVNLVFGFAIAIV